VASARDAEVARLEGLLVHEESKLCEDIEAHRRTRSESDLAACVTRTSKIFELRCQIRALRPIDTYEVRLSIIINRLRDWKELNYQRLGRDYVHPMSVRLWNDEISKINEILEAIA